MSVEEGETELGEGHGNPLKAPKAAVPELAKDRPARTRYPLVFPPACLRPVGLVGAQRSFTYVCREAGSLVPSSVGRSGSDQSLFESATLLFVLRASRLCKDVHFHDYGKRFMENEMKDVGRGPFSPL